MPDAPMEIAHAELRGTMSYRLRVTTAQRRLTGSSVLNLFCLRSFGSDGQGLGEIEQATAQGRIVDAVIGANQFNRLAPAQRIGVEGFGSGFGEAGGDRRRSHRILVVEEK
jgi:hypothetical protein